MPVPLQAGRRLRTSGGRRHETLLAVLAHYAPVGIYIGDSAGNAQYFNPQALALLGLSAAEALGRGWLQAVHPADRGRIQRQRERMYRAGHVLRAEFRILHRDGGEVWVEEMAVSWDGERRHELGRVGMLVDVTRREMAEHDLRALLEERVRRQLGPSVGRRSDDLSPQERRVVELVAEGRTNKQIGDALALSDKTVKNYLSNAFQKLGVGRRTQVAALFARRRHEG